MRVTERGPWATAELGLDLVHIGASSALRVGDLVEPGLRRNPRRAHLLVSTVLGKHLPTDPRVVLDAGDRLGDLVLAALGGRAAAAEAVVLGFAETATGLGHCVATRIDAACYLHSTRRDAAERTFATFEEGHSHATRHLLQPVPPAAFVNYRPLVLVDDEMSTGSTALEAIRALHRHTPRSHYVLASLVDMRAADDLLLVRQAAADLGARFDAVSLAQGSAVLPPNLVESVAALPDPVLNPVGSTRGGTARLELPWPNEVPDGGRHGLLRRDGAAFDDAVRRAGSVLVDRVAGLLRGSTRGTARARPVIVLGHEELMYLPLRLAAALVDAGVEATFQTTTRSPAYVLDVPGYPLRRGFRFTAPEVDESQSRYLYNARGSQDGDPEPLVVVVVDPPADSGRLLGKDGLLDVLTASGADVLLAVLPGVDPARLAAARAQAGFA